MKNREQLLAWSVGGLVVAMILYSLLSAMLLRPLAKHQNEIDARRTEYLDYQQRNQAEAPHRARLNELGARVYHGDVNQAARQLRIRLLAMARASRLDNDELIVRDIMPGKLRQGSVEVGTEVGWSVTCVGGLAELTDFLYLLKSEPRLLRVDQLVLQPRDSRTVTAGFRCTTLVLGPMKGWTPPAPATQPAEQDLTTMLASEDRARYGGIAQRDLFRPYVPRPPAPPPPAPPVQTAQNPPPPQGPPPPDYGRYRLAGLTQWSLEGEKPVLLVEQGSPHGQQYGMGQTVLDLTIVAVDYRLLPMPDQPEIMSPSRLILEQQGSYWAVELGQSLSNKRRLPEDQLPRELRKPPAATAPAEGSADAAPGEGPSTTEAPPTTEPSEPQASPPGEHSAPAQETGTSTPNQS